MVEKRVRSTRVGELAVDEKFGVDLGEPRAKALFWGGRDGGLKATSFTGLLRNFVGFGLFWGARGHR